MSGSPSAGMIDNVVQDFLNVFAQNTEYFTSLGVTLFLSLAGIQIVLTALKSIFQENIESMVIRVGSLLITLGIFYGLVLTGSKLLPQLFNGFIEAGGHVGHISSLTPSSVISQGMAIGFKFLDKFGLVGLIKHPIGTFASIIMIVVILYLYTKMAAEMAILLCKAYFFISLNGFFLCFSIFRCLKRHS